MKEAFWLTYEAMPQWIDPIARTVSASVPGFGQWMIPIHFLEGQAGGQTGHLLVGGHLRGVHATVNRFFDGEHRITNTASVPFWSLQRFVESWIREVDMVLLRLPTSLSWLFQDRRFFKAPTHVMCTLTLPGLAEVLSESQSLRTALKKAAKQPWSTQWTEEPAEFDHFFTHMHVPFVTRRFGPDASYYGRYKLRRAFRFGGLIQLLDGGSRSAGLLCRREGPLFDSLVVGEADESPSILHAGGGTLLNEAFLRRAEALGCSKAGFGLAPAQLQNGILRYKKEWGVRITHTHVRRADYFIRWGSLNEPVSHFLAETGFIFAALGRLSALFLSDVRFSAKRARAVKDLLMPGLDRLFIVHRGTTPQDAGLDHRKVIQIPFESLRGQDSATLKQILSAHGSDSVGE